MSKYVIYGDKLVRYYIEVEADTQELAWAEAKESQTHKWIQMEDDNIIEPYEIELIKEELEHTYPNMSNEILIMDKSDI